MQHITLDIFDPHNPDHVDYVHLHLERYTPADLLSIETKMDRSIKQMAGQTLMDYNVRDTEIVAKLDDKLGYINLVTSLAYLAGCNFDDVMKQTRVWDAMINRDWIKHDIIVPTRQFTATKDEQYVGAFVKEPQVGRHDWVVSFDAASLYPSTLLALNLGPDTMRDPVTFDSHKILTTDYKHPNNVLSANGIEWDKRVSSRLAEIVKTVLDGRKLHKDRMLAAEAEIERRKLAGADEDQLVSLRRDVSLENTLQAVYKVVANSCYGTMGSQFFRLYDVRIAEAITKTCQLLIQYVMQDVNEYLNQMFGTHSVDYIIAGDTDSIYVNLERVATTAPDPLADVQAFADGPLADRIKATVQKLEQKLNVYEPGRWRFKRETIARRGLWTAKKRYVLDVLMNEAGPLAEPEIKITGLEVVRSTTPEWARVAIKTALRMVMRDTEADVQAFIKAKRAEFDTLPIEDIAVPTGISSLDTYASRDTTMPYLPGSPMHFRAALLFNWYLKELGLEDKYQAIGNGDKIKYVLLVLPNRLRENVIGFSYSLPKEFNLDHRVDRDGQFQKVFLNPLVSILNKIGWRAESRKTLERFFV